MAWKTNGMTFCQAEKRDFVRDKLRPLLGDVDKSIESVEYVVDERSEMEFVIIGYPERAEKKINVTHDSLSALCQDVLRVF